MKKSRFSDQQIAFALQQAETGTVCWGCLPEAGDIRGDVLSLEGTLWWADALGGAQAKAL